LPELLDSYSGAITVNPTGRNSGLFANAGYSQQSYREAMGVEVLSVVADAGYFKSL